MHSSYDSLFVLRIIKPVSISVSLSSTKYRKFISISMQFFFELLVHNRVFIRKVYLTTRLKIHKTSVLFPSCKRIWNTLSLGLIIIKILKSNDSR